MKHFYCRTRTEKDACILAREKRWRDRAFLRNHLNRALLCLCRADFTHLVLSAKKGVLAQTEGGHDDYESERKVSAFSLACFVSGIFLRPGLHPAYEHLAPCPLPVFSEKEKDIPAISGSLSACENRAGKDCSCYSTVPRGEREGKRACFVVKARQFHGNLAAL